MRQRILTVGSALAMVAALMVVQAPPAQAAVVISIPIDTVLHAPVGSETLLATVPTGEFEGQVCTVSSITADNQNSVHPNNDLVVASGGSSVVLEDVEGEPNASVTADGELTLGDTVTVTLIMGDDHTFSAGVIVNLDCEPVVEDVSVTVTPAACEVDDQGFPSGSVSVDISPDSGATVTVYSDAAMQDVVTSFTGSGGSEDLAPGTYYWDAVAADGFELSGETSGEFTIDDCAGSVVVDGNSCTTTDDGEVPGSVDVSIDPTSSATVTVYDSDNGVVAVFTESGSSDLEPGDYTWEAVVADGFDLTGDTAGSFTVADCDEPEVESADLEISKIDLVDPVTVNEDDPTAQITYQISVDNNGPATAENVVVSDTLPATVNYVSASATTGTCVEAAGVVTCSLGDMAAGDTVVITVVVETEALGDITELCPVNVVDVTSDTEDGNPDNNTDDEETCIVEVLDVEVLPFTGADDVFLVAASMVLLGAGLTLVRFSGRLENEI